MQLISIHISIKNWPIANTVKNSCYKPKREKEREREEEEFE